MRWSGGITDLMDLEQAPGDSEGQESLACCNPGMGSHRVRHD